MQRRDYIIKWLLYVLVALLFVLVQVFVLVRIRVWGVHPFVFPAMVAYWPRWSRLTKAPFSPSPSA